MRSAWLLGSHRLTCHDVYLSWLPQYSPFPVPPLRNYCSSSQRQPFLVVCHNPLGRYTLRSWHYRMRSQQFFERFQLRRRHQSVASREESRIPARTVPRKRQSRGKCSREGQIWTHVLDDRFNQAIFTCDNSDPTVNVTFSGLDKAGIKPGDTMPWRRRLQVASSYDLQKRIPFPIAKRAMRPIPYS